MKTGKAQPDDIPDIAKLHKEGIPTGFISSLPQKVIERLYVQIAKTEILICACDENKVLAFISGTMDTGKLYKRFIKANMISMLPYMAGRLFSRSFIRKIRETLSAPSKTATKKNEMPELLSIVAAPEAKGTGIAVELLGALEEKWRQRGVKTYKVVAGSMLQAANTFYLKNGFLLEGKTEIHKGEVSNIYVKTLR